MISAEYLDIANDNLFLIFNDLSNQGVLLWAIDKIIMPLYDGVGDVSLPATTVDVLNGNLRWLQQVEGTNTDTSTSRVIDFTSDTFVSSVGILWSAASVPISLSRSDGCVSLGLGLGGLLRDGVGAALVERRITFGLLGRGGLRAIGTGAWLESAEEVLQRHVSPPSLPRREPRARPRLRRERRQGQ